MTALAASREMPPIPLWSRIGFRLVVLVLGVGILLAAGTTLARFQTLDRENRKELEEFLESIASTHLLPITADLWAMNEAQLKSDLKGLVILSELSYARVSNPQNKIMAESGTPAGEDSVTKDYPLVYQYNGAYLTLGALHIEASLKPGRLKALEGLTYDLITFSLRIFILAALILAGIHLLVTKPLAALANATRGLTLGQLDKPLDIQRARFLGSARDELDQVLAAFREMQLELAENYQELQAVNEALAMDVARRVQTEASLRQAHDRLKGIMNSMDAIVYVTDMATNEILFVNDYTRAIFGDVVGKICWQALQVGQAGPCSFCTTPRLLDKEGLPVGVISWEFRNTVNGHWYDIRDRATIWENGRLVRIEIATDITHRKEMEADLQQAKEVLEERVQERTAELERTYSQLLHAEKLTAVGKLAASVAHEFNNPLFGIRNVLKGLQRRVAMEEEDRELLDMAIRECDRVRDLIISLQQFNRPSTGVFTMVDVNQAIKEMLLFYQNKFSKRHTMVETELAPDLPSIEAVEDQVKQVLLNLLTNAEETVAEETGVIRFRTACGPDSIVIDCEDNGSGIREEDIKHIFEPFFTTKSAVKGTGLGLSVSYGIIRRHGGYITVNSTPGRGSTFSITLPTRQRKDDGQEKNL